MKNSSFRFLLVLAPGLAGCSGTGDDAPDADRPDADGPAFDAGNGSEDLDGAPSGEDPDGAPSGEVSWSIPLTGPADRNVDLVVEDDGLWIAGEVVEDGPLHAQRRELATGELEREFQLPGGSSLNAIALDAEGLYASYELIRWRVRRMEREGGDLSWSETVSTADPTFSALAAALHADGAAVYGCGHETRVQNEPSWRIEAREPLSGNILWEQFFKPTSSASDGCRGMAASGDDLFLAGALGHVQRRSKSDGAVAWTQTPTAQDVTAARAIDVDQDSVYVGGQSGRVQRRTASSGASVWTSSVSDSFVSTLVVAEEAVLALSDGNVYALSRADGEPLFDLQDEVTEVIRMQAKDGWLYYLTKATDDTAATVGRVMLP